MDNPPKHAGADYCCLNCAHKAGIKNPEREQDGNNILRDTNKKQRQTAVGRELEARLPTPVNLLFAHDIV